MTVALIWTSIGSLAKQLSQPLQGPLDGRLRAATRLVTGLINHPLGRTYNRNLMITGEHDALVDAMPSTAAWMNSHGCELIVHDPEKPMSADPDAADN